MRTRAEETVYAPGAFWSIFLVSMLIHGGILIRVAALYQTPSLACIDLTLASEKPVSRRSIPIPPRPRVNQPVQAASPEKLQVRSIPPVPVKPLDPSDLETAAALPSISDLPALANAPVAAVPAAPAAGSGVLSGREYADLLRMRIESQKHYPESARQRHMEGRVIIGFLLNKDGSTADIRILKSSGHTLLDQAGKRAVQKASPFPPPPREGLVLPASMRIALLFSLT